MASTPSAATAKPPETNCLTGVLIRLPSTTLAAMLAQPSGLGEPLFSLFFRPRRGYNSSVPDAGMVVVSPRQEKCKNDVTGATAIRIMSVNGEEDRLKSEQTQ
jgi:hypothetical protein